MFWSDIYRVVDDYNNVQKHGNKVINLKIMIISQRDDYPVACGELVD